LKGTGALPFAQIKNPFLNQKGFENMNRNKSRLLVALALTLTIFSAPFARAANASTPAADTLLSALPASDGVILIDLKQLFDKAIPGLLASEPALIEKMNAEMRKAANETGVDPYSFEQVAIGFRLTENAMKGQSPPFVALLRGSFDADDLIQKGLKAGRKSQEPPDVREEKYQNKTIYFIKDKAKPKASNDDSQSNMSDDVMNKMRQEEVAIVALDAKTVALGEPASVRAAINSNSGSGDHVDKNLIDLATRTNGAVVGFSGYVPASAFKQITANGDPISVAASGIQSYYGSVNSTNGDFETRLILRTEKTDQAQTLSAAAKLGVGFVGDSLKNSSMTTLDGKQVDASAYLKYLTIKDEGNEVIAVYKVPQADLQPLIHALAAPKKSSGDKQQSASEKQ
jgi:hypothetical protein